MDLPVSSPVLFSRGSPSRQQRRRHPASTASSPECGMSGILAWAADVVGGAGAANDDEADDARAVASAAMTPEQRLRAADLDAKAASLRRSIHDLRLRVPPPHVAQRLPHLHAHSLASSAALALQLNAHSSTKEQPRISIPPAAAPASCFHRVLAGILAWAADVVGGAGAANDDEADDARAVASAAMTPEQRLRAADLDAKAASLRRSIHDLRLRVPPPHVAQRLPHLHAHSLASSAALALQLNAHSSTKEQALQREITLQEENAAYEKAISNCRQKIQEKQMEVTLLQSNLKEMEISEQDLKAQLDNAQNEQYASQNKASAAASDNTGNALMEAESLINLKSNDLKEKNEELAQAEGLIVDVHAKEKELERLNNLHRNLHSRNNDGSVARNPFRAVHEDYDAKAVRRPYQFGLRTEGLKRLMILRSAFVLYILVLHIVVFIKLSVSKQ
uniref:Uncharacterized protein n=1 Tax=Oryza meridionalis TaxID=40149 RepID=A0A0E0EIT8_9ORYZ